MKIVAATDFSPGAANAARSAARLARKLGDSLVLVRVIEPPVDSYPELRIPDSSQFDAALREANQVQMEAAVAELREEGVLVEGRVLLGSPVATLVAEALAKDTRLIVVGSHGRGPISRFFIGSVAERTALSAACPVLVVPVDAAPFNGWIDERPLRILAGLDTDAAGEALVARVKELRQAGPCDVTFVHTYWPPGEYARLGLPGPRDLMATDPEVVVVLEREIETRFGIPAQAAGWRLVVHSAWGRAADALTDDAQAERADLLVVGTRQLHGGARLRSGSSSIAVLRAARTAVLCVPAGPRSAAASSDAPVPNIRSVLCPTDFSGLGNAAVPHAYSLVRAGGTVELCHVCERRPATPAYLPYPLTPPVPAAEKAELEARLRALVPKAADDLHITTHVTVLEGPSVAEGIVQAARRLGTDVITLASHGRSGLTRALLASVAEEVLRQSDRPVFVVRSRS